MNGAEEAETEQMQEASASPEGPPESSHASQTPCPSWLRAGWGWHCVWEELREESLIHSANILQAPAPLGAGLQKWENPTLCVSGLSPYLTSLLLLSPKDPHN